MASSSTVRILQKRSAIGAKIDQKRTLRALGLRRIGQSAEHTLNPALEGMIAKVRHLLEVENLSKTSK